MYKNKIISSLVINMLHFFPSGQHSNFKYSLGINKCYSLGSKKPIYSHPRPWPLTPEADGKIE